MTIDEAKRLLAQYIDYDAETPNYYDMEEACKVAIKALEQEPKPSVSEKPNNCDLISREEVLENAFKIYTHECGLLEVVGVATIETLPSIKPQEKTGYWIGIDDKPHEDYECNRCGYICSTFTANIKPSEEYKYCPNCGARMSENPTSSKPEISSYYGLKSYVRERSDKK